SPLGDLGELRWIAEQDQVAGGGAHREGVGEGDLPRLVDDERVDEIAAVEVLVGEQPRRAGQELDAPGPLDQLAGVLDVGDPVTPVLRLGVAGAALLEAADRHAFLAGGLADLVEQVVDRLVARGRDADAPTAADEIDDDPRARPRLAGARRPLDEEIALVEGGGSLSLLAKVHRLDRPAESAGEPRPRPGKDVLER